MEEEGGGGVLLVCFRVVPDAEDLADQKADIADFRLSTCGPICRVRV